MHQKKIQSTFNAWRNTFKNILTLNERDKIISVNQYCFLILTKLYKISLLTSTLLT